MASYLLGVCQFRSDVCWRQWSRSIGRDESGKDHATDQFKIIKLDKSIDDESLALDGGHTRIGLCLSIGTDDIAMRTEAWTGMRRLV